jgi:DNA-formamidopyrimidine glycosylase
MPEGPEVTKITELVRKLIISKNLTSVNSMYTKLKQKGLSEIQKVLPLTIKEIKNNGKLMWFELEDNWYIFITFGLSGGFYKSTHSKNRLQITCDDGTILYYRDKLNYGSLTFTNDPKVIKKKFSDRGFNLFGEDKLSLEHFTALLNKPRGDPNICDFLCTKQKYLSGIGNYLKCEILYHAKLSPYKTIKTLTKSEIKKLYNSIKEVSRKALIHNGRTSNYTDLIACEDCTFETQFMVYQKSDDPLITCEKTPDKRKTYYVKSIQK